MPIRVEQIHVIGMAKAVPTRPEFHALTEPQTARHVACFDDVVNTIHDIAEMMPRRPPATPRTAGQPAPRVTSPRRVRLAYRSHRWRAECAIGTASRQIPP